jgi:hypothetical protein
MRGKEADSSGFDALVLGGGKEQNGQMASGQNYRAPGLLLCTMLAGFYSMLPSPNWFLHNR